MLSRIHLRHLRDDLAFMTTLASRIWTPDIRWHSGDLTWTLAEHRPVARCPSSAWCDGDILVAWARVPIPGCLDLQIDPEYSDVVSLVLDWFEGLPGHSAESEDAPLTVTVHRNEIHITEELARRGYQPDESGPFFNHLTRDLRDLPEPSVPEGYRLRSVSELPAADDPEMRASVHAAAFSTPDRPSRMTADAYRQVMLTPLYRPGLDWFVEHGGEAAAFCLIWWDPESGSACLEPVGCRPEHRRLGLASAVIQAALREVADLGATVARVCARGDADYPSAQKLYQSVGFNIVGRNDTWRRPRDENRE